MKDFWNERYADGNYAYGVLPNAFFNVKIDKIQPGKILLPAEGEGRNAIYAASLGWEVSAVDFSEQAREKALVLAHSKGLSIDYQISEIENFNFKPNSYEAIALVYAHFHPSFRAMIHQKCVESLKIGGFLILEGFNPLQLNNTSGGPKNLEMLYTPEMLAEDFEGMDIIQNEVQSIDLDEGDFHQGKADVVRFFAQKVS